MKLPFEDCTAEIFLKEPLFMEYTVILSMKLFFMDCIGKFSVCFSYSYPVFTVIPIFVSSSAPFDPEDHC